MISLWKNDKLIYTYEQAVAYSSISDRKGVYFMIDKESAVKKPITQVCIFTVISLIFLSASLFFLYSYQKLNKNIEQERRDYVS